MFIDITPKPPNFIYVNFLPPAIMNRLMHLVPVDVNLPFMLQRIFISFMISRKKSLASDEKDFYRPWAVCILKIVKLLTAGK